MKKLFLVLTFFSLIPVFAQQSNRSLVNVTGEGVVKVVPDQVIIKGRIEHEGKSATDVKKQNDDAAAQVIKFLKSQGIKEEDFKTDFVNLNKQHDYNTKTDKYVANQGITIMLHEIKNYEKIMSGLFQNGMNRINGIEFKSSKMADFEKEARKLAVLDAQSKAQELAEPLGQSIGKAVSISEMENNWVQPMYRMEMAEDVSAAKQTRESIAPGELEVKIRVNIGFELN